MERGQMLKETEAEKTGLKATLPFDGMGFCEIDADEHTLYEDVFTTIFSEIVAERAHQDEKWGGPDWDDELTCKQWEDRIIHYAWGLKSHIRCKSFRDRMIKVAALGVAAIQACDRNPDKFSS
jgi:hypothetical protein